jgi:ATP-dependent Clp protease ATP-binding subunit ClpA
MHKITLPYKAVRLQFFDNKILVPLSEHSVIRIDSSMPRLANQFEKSIQKKVLDKGYYSAILEIADNDGSYELASITVGFPAAKDHFSYPDFQLTFDYYYNVSEKGVWAVLPSLGIECFAEDAEQLDKTIQDNIRLEFARKKRLSAVQNIVTSIWSEVVELEEDTISFDFHTPSELAALSEKEKEKILPKVAQKLSFKAQITFGRTKEIAQLANTLKGKFNKSVIIVGKSGVGKTALVWEMVRQAKQFEIEAKFYETTASTMIKELTQETGWQDNLVYLCRELANEGDFLFIRNLLELFEVGQYEGNSVSMAEYLRTFIGRGEVTMISECTEEEFAKIELRSPNFLSLFQIIRLEEPREGLEKIIIDKVKQIANTRNIVIEDEAIDETIRLNRRYTPYSGFPGKPIRFLESIILNKNRKNENENEKNKQSKNAKITINRSTAIQHFCEETGMPDFMVNPEKPMDLNQIQQFFSDNIFGQKAAVDSVINLLASVKTALTRQGKPIASFLFVGPTGVGKTEMAKVLADFMFGSREKIVRFDMSEFSTPYAVMRLTGMSYFEDGLLTSAVKREPFCVLLFDEIEKADGTFYDLLLQLLSEGRLTDSQGKLVNFCSTIIIMTSNIGASNLQNNKIGWSKGVDVTSVNEHFLSAVQKHFRPELFNRIDEVIAFQPLSKTDIRFIVDREIEIFKGREGIRHRNIDFYLEDEIFDFLGEIGYDPKYGARKLQRVVREALIIPLAKKLNTFEYDEQLIVNISLWENELVLDIDADPLKFDLLLEELEKYQYTDYASELRRSIQRLKEGSFFVKMMSDLDILERQKRNKPNKFWKDEKTAQRYTLYLTTVQKIEDLTAIVENYEDELSLACMNLTAYRPQMIEKIKAWESDYFDYKVELFNRVNPQSNQAKFYLIGSEINDFYEFYKPLFIAKSYQFKCQLIWYREPYFNEMTTVKKEMTNQNGTTETIDVEVKQEKYIFTDFDENSAKRYEGEDSDKLVGMEISITGICPALFLFQENGLHEWGISDKLTFQSFIFVNEGKTELNAKDLHSPIFWKRKKARRIYKDEHLWDAPFEINREIPRNKYLAYLLPILNQRFESKLNEVLL